MNIKIRDNDKLIITLLELRNFYELFWKFFNSYGRYPRFNEWHNLYLIKILDTWSSNDFTNLPKDLFSEIDFKLRIKSIQIKFYDLLTNKISYIYKIVKGYDSYRFEIDNSYLKFLAIKSFLSSLSKFNATDSYKSFSNLLEYSLKKEIDENPGYFGEDNFYIQISNLIDLEVYNNLNGLDRLIFNYSPALLSIEKSKYEVLLNSYAENELHFISAPYFEENDRCKSIMNDSDCILSLLTAKEKKLLIFRYGLNNKKKKLFKEIKEEMNYESYIDILITLNYSFWKLKASWPIDFLSYFLFNKNIGFSGINFTKQNY